MTKAVYYLLKHKSVSYRDKIKLCLYFTEIKEVIRIYNEDIALKRLLNNFNDILVVFTEMDCKKDPSGLWFTAFMRAGFVPRTTNHVENYHRQTDPDQIKKTFL